MFDQFQPTRDRSTQSFLLSLGIHTALGIAILAAGFTVKSIVAPSRSISVQWIAPVAVPRVKRPTVRAPKFAIPKSAKLATPRLTAPPPPILEPAPTVLPVAAPKEAFQPPVQLVQPPVQKEVFTAAAPAAKGNSNTPAKVQLGG